MMLICSLVADELLDWRCLGAESEALGGVRNLAARSHFPNAASTFLLTSLLSMSPTIASNGVVRQEEAPEVRVNVGARERPHRILIAIGG